MRQRRMRSLARLILLIALALAIPAVPVLIAGPAIEQSLARWLQQHDARSAIAAAVVGLLATDTVLPVPSSFVSTLAGARLGIGLATAATWLGMTAGAIIAFALSRRLGRPLA